MQPVTNLCELLSAVLDSSVALPLGALPCPVAGLMECLRRTQLTGEGGCGREEEAGRRRGGMGDKLSVEC